MTVSISSSMDVQDTTGDDQELNEGEIDDRSHKKLLNAVTQLYRKQRIAAPKRNEPSQQISEFNLTQPIKQRKLGAADLLADLRQRATHHQLVNKVKSIQNKAAPLPKPLEKFISEKISRQSGYSAVRDELGEWEALVQKNRAADQLKFPLRDEKIKFERDVNFLNTTKPSDLELKMAEVLRKELAVQEGKPEESSEIANLSLEEVLQRRQMVAKMRARESYRIAKAVRQNKIKSKKYHRVLKRERIKKELKEFELLQKTDPEAALAKMDSIERARAEERISLRHRNTGKWARGLAIRSKYDAEARAQLADNLRKSRELTNKAKNSMDTDSEEEGYEDVDLSAEGATSKENPWVGQEDNEVASFVSGYRKFWNEQNRKKEQKNGESHVTGILSNGSNEVAGGESEPEEPENSAGTNSDKRDLSIEKEFQNGTTPAADSENDEEEMSDLKLEISGTAQSEIEVEEKKVSGEAKLEEEQSPAIDKKKKSRKRNRKPKKSKSKTGGLDEKGLDGMKVNLETAKEFLEPKRKAKKRSFAISSNSGEWVVEDDVPGDAAEDEERRNIVTIQARKPADKKKTIENLFEEVEMSEVPKATKEKQSKQKKNQKLPVKPADSAKNPQKPSHLDLSFKKSESLSVDESLIEMSGEGISSGLSDVRNLLKKVEDIHKPAESKITADIDPTNFLPVKTQKVNTAIPNLVDNPDSDSDDERSQHLNLMEAFADDDIADEFRREKEEEEKGSKPTEVDLSLPGWGSWSGPGITKKPRRQKKVKFPAAPRKDANKPTIIINDDLPKEFVSQQVSDLPPQFVNVATYESLIRAPLGDTWVPQAIHKTLIAPKVVTKMGQIIEPVDKSELAKKDEGAVKGMEPRKPVARKGETKKVAGKSTMMKKKQTSVAESGRKRKQ